MSSARARDGRVQITVSDTGVGIKPEDLNRIFDLYFTTKSVGAALDCHSCTASFRCTTARSKWSRRRAGVHV